MTVINDQIRYYDNDQITNVSREFVITEFIREKVFNLTNEEVPYSVACVIEHIEEEKEKIVIYANIIVDRDNLKKIIIGQKGTMIKEIGIKARKDIEAYLDKKVYLNLFVKTIKDWREKDSYLKEFGIKFE